MNHRTSLFLSIITLLLVGCGTLPKVPAVLDVGTGLTRYATNDFLVDYSRYQTAFTNANTNLATALRNMMISRVRLDVEGNFHDFESELFGGRALVQTAEDWAEFALAMATTITVGERAKTVLAAILTAVKGARLSVDKNWFREKATEAIISSMKAERQKKLTLIETKLSGNAMEYPFEEAWVDLLEYFYAGTLQGGIQAIAENAGKESADTKVELKEATKERASKFSLLPATREQINKTKVLTRRRLEMEKDKAANVGEARRILKEADVTVPADASNDEVFKLLATTIEKASKSGEEELDKLLKAFSIKQP